MNEYVCESTIFKHTLIHKRLCRVGWISSLEIRYKLANAYVYNFLFGTFFELFG